MKKLIFILIGIFISNLSYSQLNDPVQELEIKVVRGQFDSAIIVANQILLNDSSNWLVHYYLGKSYQANYKSFKAIEYFKKANKLDSANIVIENSLASAYDFIGKDEEAIGIYYNQYLRDTTVLEPIINLANIFRRKKEYASAIHYYQKAVFLDVENFYYYKNLAYCFDKINITVGAIYNYQTAIMLNPYDESLYIQLANILNSERSFLDAIETCNSGLKINPESSQLLKIKSYAYYLNRDFDSSIVGFNKLIENGDSSLFSIKFRGLSYFEKKEFVKAIDDLQVTRTITDKDPEVCFYLGSALARTGFNDDGLDYLNRSLRLISPSKVELSNLYSEMAYVFQNQEKYDLSLDYLKLAYKNNPSPLLSFKMAQLYDYNLKDKELALNYYMAYATLSSPADSLLLKEGSRNSKYIVDSAILENANYRIRILKEELFFESAKKD